MKQFIFCIFCSLLCSITYGQATSSNQEILLEENNDDRPLNRGSNDTSVRPTTRGLISLPVHAYLNNQWIIVNFVNYHKSAVISITNEATGEVVHQLCTGYTTSATILLGNLPTGIYMLEIVIDEVKYNGTFIIEGHL